MSKFAYKNIRNFKFIINLCTIYLVYAKIITKKNKKKIKKKGSVPHNIV